MWSVDTAVYVHAAGRRSGVGRALYEKLFMLLVEQGYFRACAGIALPNDASVALHTALGFSAVGTYHRGGYKLGAWHDAGLATPLLIAADEFARSLDAFPFEFGAILWDHVVVAGSNPFDGLSVKPADLRRALRPNPSHG